MHPSGNTFAGKYKRIYFVSAGDSIQTTDLQRTEGASKFAVSGQEVRSFYETLLAEPSTSVVLSQTCAQSGNRNERAGKRKLSKNIQKKQDTDGVNFMQFLKDAAHGNLEGVRNFCRKGLDIDETDQYGWTALMCASHAGHLNIVKHLLSKGVDIRKRSKSGETAADLALKGGHSKVHRYIIKYSSSSSQNESTETVKKSPKKSAVERICEACHCSYIDEASHLSSVAHLLETRKPVLDPGYGIPEWNKGYRMLRSSGWDEFEGLGRDAAGRRYPVRTVLKRDRLGLGCASDTPKVTHFKANDVNAVKMKSTARGQEMRDHKKRLLREKNLERKLRSMFRDG